MSAKTSALPFTSAMLSHPGRVRKGNEDACAASLDLGAFLVCDGMGGAAAGEVASRLAVDTFLAQLAPAPADPERTPPALRRATPDLRLNAAIQAANQAVHQHSRSSPQLRGMGTTLVALLLELHATTRGPQLPSLTLAHVGDSRAYLFRENTLTLLTADHSLVEEQVRSGQITASEAMRHPMRNIITRAIGSSASVEPDIRHLEAASGDLYLLASDGLTRDLTDASLAAILQRAHRDPDRTLDLDGLCRTLIDEANDAGGGDNITVLLLQLP